LENIANNIVCPSCKTEIELDNDDRNKKFVRCPECNSLIDISKNPIEIVKDKNYIQILTSMNQGDLGIIQSMLDDGNIDYFIDGKNFLSVDPLIQPAKIMVLEEQYEEAKEIIKDFELNIFGISSNNEDDEEDDPELQ
jgi:predicted Zn finger-like uncharacterized protein